QAAVLSDQEAKQQQEVHDLADLLPLALGAGVALEDLARIGAPTRLPQALVFLGRALLADLHHALEPCTPFALDRHQFLDPSLERLLEPLVAQRIELTPEDLDGRGPHERWFLARIALGRIAGRHQRL